MTRRAIQNQQDGKGKISSTKKGKKENRFFINKYWNQSWEIIIILISERGGHRVGRERLCSGSGRSGQRNLNSSNKLNKRPELTIYPYGTKTDQQTEMFTKVKEHLILKIQSEFFNESDIAG